ncbi:hypothetical protein Q760_02385 [Cellulomonas cellasea DSM 20118]|uniref:Uncharacterized protein n=1 Tax=Cellulomonas cellasea DSM 20118 TaxID=1408250 RepID=A0A0A0BCD3_9CELL|nr:hypothetical protein Q760_02385 [Cellulomonas cellasea DSM 20118]
MIRGEPGDVLTVFSAGLWSGPVSEVLTPSTNFATPGEPGRDSLTIEAGGAAGTAGTTSGRAPEGGGSPRRPRRA